jgi:uncharacterized membrane protein
VPSHLAVYESGVDCLIFRGVLRALRDFARVNFLAGVFIAVPFAITIVCLAWVWGKLHGPLKKIFEVTITDENMPWSDIGMAINDANWGMLVIPLIGLALVLFSVLILGILARSILGRMTLMAIENLIERLPVIGMLYMSLKQLGEAFMGSDGTSKFQRAVGVQFPYKGVWAIGFVTGNAEAIQAQMPGLEKPKTKQLTDRSGRRDAGAELERAGRAETGGQRRHDWRG